jgi:hypothetical protein
MSIQSAFVNIFMYLPLTGLALFSSVSICSGVSKFAALYLDLRSVSGKVSLSSRQVSLAADWPKSKCLSAESP